MTINKIKDNVFAVGALDPQRRLFDELIPLPDGTSYNAYLIKGSEKTALLDTVDPQKENDLVNNLRELKLDRIDYIIVHHCEQDHSGSIPKMLDLYKSAKVVTNQKCKDLLKEHLLIPEDKIMVISDREKLSLGDKTLEFIFTPWVHWPETMCTYLKEDKILFSCDFFGSHVGSQDVYVSDKEHLYKAAKRYYAEIMMPFRANIINNLEKLKGLPIDIIAPSHGPVHKEPGFIIDAYKDWISDSVKNAAVVPYVSMHGSTDKMVKHLIRALEQKGIAVKPFYLSKMDLGELAMEMVDAATIVLGIPTVLAGPHPLGAYAAFLANALRPKTKFISVVGSYGWGGRTLEILQGMINNLKVEVIDPVIVKGYPKSSDLTALDELAEKIYSRHKMIGITK